ncbi:protocadherin Fat 4-like [Dysidea avara]|uniref:protocadherin Fat 4-like n=1 Tax=Dysidea avara TaxID=196820 RepID=UPI0033279D69
MQNNSALTSATDVNCLHAFSVPLSDQYLEFRLLDSISRPGITNIDSDPLLKDFSLATHVRIVLIGWYSQQMIFGHRYFAISEVFISGRPCTCNGHASACDGSECVCQHNTMGPNCEECLPLFNGRPWAAGTVSSANECRKCTCNDHSDTCVYQDDTGVGLCTNCIHNTMGDNCEQCLPLFYTPSNVPFTAPNACQACDCDPAGVMNTSVMCLNDGTGQCPCKSLATGRQCDTCMEGYFNLTADNLVGCEPCVCNTTGIVQGPINCDMYTGQCPCLPNVGELDCSQCLPGYYGFGNPSGCQACDEQCSNAGCCGPGPTNCQNCRNFEDVDGSTCVAVCPANAFPDNDRNCQLCNGSCLAFSRSFYEISVEENVQQTSALLILSISDRRSISRPVEYTIVSGNDELYFTLNSSSGQLFIIREADREQISSFRLQVQVADIGTSPTSTETAQASIVVTVDDMNDSPPLFVSLPYTATVLENSPQSTTVLTVSTTDDDIGTNAIVGYAITNGNEGGYFMINQLSGIITTTNLEIDYENVRNFSLTLSAIDGGIIPLTSTAVVSIEVIDANDIRPVFTQAVYQSVLSESSVIGTSVAQLVAVDGDTTEDNVLIQYQLLDGLDTFIIDNLTGLIRTSASLDYEAITLYNLTVVVSNGVPNNEPMGTSTVSVFITDVNDNAPQFNSSVISTTIDEDISIGQTVLELSVIDNDSGNNSMIDYIIVNNTMLPFVITNNGVLITDELLDREAVAAYTFTVLAVDRGDPPMTGSASITITLSDVNDNEPVFTDDMTELEYAEDLSVDTIITAVVATDNDIGLNSQLSYSFVSGNEEMRFSIDMQNGEIVLNNSLDFETTQVYRLQIVARDSGVPALSATANVIINITDINDSSPVFNQSQYNVTVLEVTTANSVIFTASATDADVGTNANISYSIVTGNSDNTFIIDSNTGIISLRRPLNFESTQSYLLTLSAVNLLSDNPLQGTTRLVIFVSDVNEFFPRFTQAAYEATVLENRPAATSVFQAVATDSDAGSSGKLEYQIFSGNSAGNFEIFRNSGLIVTTRPIDREDVDMFNLQILVSDGGTPSFSALASVAITVLDVNDNPPMFSSSNYSAVVSENSPTGVSISVFPMLRTTDIDMDGSNTQVTYSIVGSFPFSIAPQTGELSVSDDIDFENESSYSVTILAVDGGVPMLSSITSISITVVNLNDNAPMIRSAPTTVMFVEGTVNGVLITPDVVVIDVDDLPISLMTISLIDLNGNPITFPDTLAITTTPTVQSMTSDGGKVLQVSGSFTTSDATNMLRTLTFINEENEPDSTSRFVRITVSDGTFVSTAVRVRIDIELINDNAPVLLLGGQSSVYNVSFTEGSSPVRITGDVTIEDADSSPIISALLTITDPVDGSSEGFMLLNGFPDELSVENNVSSLLLQGSVSASVYEFALENIVYFNIAEEPGTPLRRTVDFTISDDQFNGETATTIIDIILMNDPPRLDLGGNIDYETTFLEGTGFVRLSSSSFMLSDNDNTSLDSAVVSLVNPLDGSGEALLVNLTEDNSTVSVIQQPHQIVVIGLADINVYSNILSSIQYSNTLANPSSDRRMVEFTVSDGILNSTTATAFVSFTLVNNPPIVDLNGPELGGNFTTVFQEGGSAISITSENIIIRDIDSPSIAFAVVELRNPVDVGQEGLTLRSVDSDVDILFSADNGSITVSGEANSSVYSTVFQELQYYNTAEQPTVEERLIAFLVNDGSANSTLVFTTITVNQVDDVPMLTISSDPVFMIEYIEEASAVRMVDLFAVSITDGDNTTLDSLLLVVSGLLDGNNEVIEFSDPSGDRSLSVQQSNLPDGSRRYVFRFSESFQTITNFELLLQTLRYANTLLEPTAGFRSLQFTISDGITESIPVYSNLSVVLINDNSPEFDNFIYSASVMENAVGVTVITLTATDTDASTGQFGSHGIIVYSIAGGNQDGLFSIDSQTGDIVIEVASDRESETGTFGGLLSVEARNPGSSQQDFANVLITITDINDNAPQFVNFTDRFTISELAQSGSVVGLVSAQDVDAGSNAEIRYTLSQTTTIPLFAIDRFTGQITVASTAQLDYELQPQYTITVTVTDRGRPALRNSSLVMIDLIDENDNAPMFEQASYTVSIFESAQVGDEVLAVRAVDADFGGNDSLVYTITTDDDSVPFTSDTASGIITVNGSLDRELIPSYTFSVTASDPVGNFDSANVTVTIEDTNDNVPTFMQVTYFFSIREDAGVDFIVGAVTAVDSDIGTNADILYTIEDLVPFHIISTSGVLVVNQELDREMESFYQFIVLANNTDGLEGFDAANVTVTITDVNDNTPLFTEQVYEVTVEENFPLFVAVVTVVANDSDIGTNAIITYQLLPSSNSGIFAVNKTTGEIYLVANIDYETQSEYTLTITATDGTRSSQAVISVSVSDENDNTPIFDSPSYSGTVAENTLSASILMVRASDNDSGVNQQIVYSILTTEDSFPFSINDTSGVIFLTRMLDREENDEYTFLVVAEDRGIPSLNSTATIVITVEDRNDNAPIFDQIGYNTSQTEGTEDVGTVIFKVSAIDNDAGSNSVVMYSIVAGNERGHFSIDPFTGEVSLVTPLDAETIQQHELIVEATDRGTPVQSNNVTAHIDVENINDNIPVISLNSTSVMFQEGGNAITVAPSIVVEDGDVDHSLLQANISLICPCGDERLILGGLSDTIIVSDRHITINGPIADTTVTEILQTVLYLNSDEEPDPQERLVIFTIDDGMTVVIANVTIIIFTINDQAPVVDLNITDPNTVNSQTTFIEGSSSVLVFGTVVNITDEDFNGDTLDYVDLTLSGPLDATASITATPNGLVRVLSFGPTMLQLIGPAPHTDFVNALTSVSYHNTGNNPRQPLQRTVEVIANDGMFNATAIGIIVIETINDPPVIQLSDQFNYSTTFLEGRLPVSLVSSLSISDPDSTTLQSASIELIDSAQGSSEYLIIESHENTSTEINETSILISGPAPINDFIVVLSSARYFTNASNPVFGIRTVLFTVNDGELLTEAYVDVEVIMQNDPPVISLNMGSNITEFIESGPPVTFIPTSLTVTDEDSDIIHFAVVTLRNVMDGSEEILQLPPHPNLTSTYNPLLGQLMIQGEAMPRIYEEALISVTYNNMAEEPSAINRQIEVTVTDGLATSDSIMLIIHITLTNDSPQIQLCINC